MKKLDKIKNIELANKKLLGESFDPELRNIKNEMFQLDRSIEKYLKTLNQSEKIKFADTVENYIRILDLKVKFLRSDMARD